jgi:hypothetical protein
MGRKPKNSYEETEIANVSNSGFKLFDVEIPLAVRVDYSAKIGGSIQNPIWGDTFEIIYLPMSEKNAIFEQCKKLGYNKIKIAPWTVKMPDICPDCKNKGVPKIENKSTFDNRTRSERYEEKKELPKRSDEKWLVYFHKSNRKKCRIQQCIATSHPSFKNNLRKQINIERYFFPNCLEWMKTKNFI